MKRIIFTENAPKAIGPYSQAISTDNLIFTSGQIALDPDTQEMVKGGIEEQAKRVILNLKSVLEAGGSSLEKVIKTTIFLKDMRDFTIANQMYAEFFKDKPPARSTIQAASLPKDALIEIDAIALID